MMKKEYLARKVLILCSTIAVLGFTCGFVGTKFLIGQDEQSKEFIDFSQMLTPICSAKDITKGSKSCFSATQSSYNREFLIWRNVKLNKAEDWPTAINEDEEAMHADRFDGVKPKIYPTNKKGSVTTDKDGEGGRRLFDNLEKPQKALREETRMLGMVAYNRDTKNRFFKNAEYPWNHIVEPYRATTLELSNTDPTATYRWTVNDHVHGYGTSVEALFSKIGYHNVKIEEMIANEDGTSTTNLLVVKVMCKYVRREIRSMSNLDRETWFSAIAVMQHVPTSTGQAIYGPKYLSKDAFTRIHLYYGGAMDCDHWHQGAGFVTSHVALTLQWEQALQAINPTIAAPYWDFTLESTFYGSRDWHNSFVFSNDWFGDSSPDNALHTVTEGRFQYVPTLLDAKKFSYWVNSYGMLRAPWNNDPTPFLTRSGKIYGYHNNMKPSGCREYRVASQKTTWMALSKQLNSAAHGHIHELMGGVWNHYLKNIVKDASSPAIYNFAHAMQTLSKILWRFGYVECPDTCLMTDAFVDCQCQCSAESLKGKTSLQILIDTGIINSVPFFDKVQHKLDASNFLDENGDPANPIPGYTVEETKHLHDNILGLLCNPGHIGDMYQATSSNDITFWLIHLTVDRLWHYKRLGNSAGYDETWDPYHKCYGHNPDNYQPFKDLFTMDSEDSENYVTPGHYYTNMDLYNNLHPTNRNLQYTYEDFDWDHCEKIGVSFSNT